MIQPIHLPSPKRYPSNKQFQATADFRPTTLAAKQRAQWNRSNVVLTSHWQRNFPSD
jgi:hypothetical protein